VVLAILLRPAPAARAGGGRVNQISTQQHPALCAPCVLDYDENIPITLSSVLFNGMNKSEHNNYAFIDGQNLYMGTAKREVDPWKIDLARFRVYLAQKYGVSKAFYFLGYLDESQQLLYENLQSAGFIVVFREHTSLMLGKKKGNVDSDLILNVMKKLYYKELFDKVVLVSGDGDYKQLVDFLITESRLEKILFPDRERASSLYKKLGAPCFAALDEPDTRRKVEMKKAP